jgi:hypothetical protein
MKKNSLTTAVVAGIAGVAGFVGLANAVDLNPDGVGQVLIYPYYTVNKGQSTLLSVVNTSDVGKAVKVRFLEGYNSREVLDFNLFLSPYDVWTAAVTENADTGGGQMLTADHSCIDTLTSNPQKFSTRGFDGTLTSPAVPWDKGPKTADRTREGYVEMISMGDIIPGSALDKAVTHKQTGVANAAWPLASTKLPTAGCGAPVGDDTVVPTMLTAPTGGLFGSGAVVNVGEGTFFAYNADAIDGFVEAPIYSGSQSLKPTLQDAKTPSVATNGLARAFVFTEGGKLLTADYARGEDAVSAVFMADAIYNEYNVEADLGASSDWVVTFPTKRFYVDKGLYPSAITAPFALPFTGTSNVELSMVTFDREELGSEGPNAPRCPSPPDDSCFLTAPYLAYEVNVITFVDETPTASSVLGSKLFKSVTPVGPNGWAAIDLAYGDSGAHVLGGGIEPVGATPVAIPGLPATGFYANNVINANAAPGKLSNYSGVWRHRAHRSCTGQDPACS